MNNYIETDTLEKAWIKALRTTILSGQLVQDENPFFEIRNLQIVYHNAFEIQIDHYKRIFGTKFLDYMSRVYSPSGDTVTGRNYHKIIYPRSDTDQVAQVVKKLRAEPFTRSAIIVLATAGASKQPCVTEVNFSIRNDLLYMTVLFKSSDFAKKFIPDMVELSHIHAHISRELGIARGSVAAHVLSAQLYEMDYKAVSNAIASAPLGNHYETRRVIENWDKEAAEWDKNIQRPEYYVNIENGYSRFLDFFNKEIPESDQNVNLIALDSGCGTGIIAGALKNKGYCVFGVDISPQMLRFANKNMTSAEYVLANSLDLPYHDDHFDVICSRGVLISHVGKKYVDNFLNEHHRVLKPRGLFMFDFITHFNPSENEKRRKKAHMSFKRMSQYLGNHGFEVVVRTGTDAHRVNAVICRKING